MTGLVLPAPAAIAALLARRVLRPRLLPILLLGRLVVVLLAVGAGLLGAGFLLLQRDQPFTVGDRDLVVVGMDLAEGEKPVPVAAIFDERRLQAGFDPDDLGEVDVALELLLRRGLYVVIVEPVTVEDDDARLFRVGRVDQHTLGHGGRNSGGPGVGSSPPRRNGRIRDTLAVAIGPGCGLRRVGGASRARQWGI